MSWSRSLPALLLLAACNLSNGPGGSHPGTQASSETPEQAEEAAPQVLQVRIRAVGPSGVIPREIVARASQPLFRSEEIGGPLPRGNAIKMVPSTKGTWKVSATDAMTFTPDEPLQPEHDYEVSVLTMGTGEPRHPDPGVTWATNFHTPPFAFERLAMKDRDQASKRVTVDLVFSGPVQPEDVAAKATFHLGDAVVRPIYRGASDEPNEAEFVFSGARYFQDAKLSVDVAPGVPMHPAPAGVTAQTTAAGKGQVDLKVGEAMKILAVHVKEGTNGFYVDVICNDDAGGDQRYWWDRESWDDYYVSERCEVPLAAAQRAIHFDPGVDFSVAPGPAGFRLFGDFERGPYAMTMDAGLRTVDGGVLGSSFQSQFKVPARSPSVQFTAKGRYLPRSAWKQLSIRHVNIDAVELTVRHVPEDDLVFWMSGDEPATSRTSNVLLKKRIPVKDAPDAELTSWIDVGSLLPKAGKGIYELKVRGIDTETDKKQQANPDVPDTGYMPSEPDETGPVDSSRLLLTDLQVIAKLAAAGPDQKYAPAAHVWVIGTHDERPVPDAEVRAVRPSGQTLGTCRTDASGGCTVSLKQDPNDDTPPMALLVRKDDDLTYLKFSDLQIAPPADTNGLSYLDEQPYRAAIYTDRGVYRPGDVAHVAGIVRTAQGGFAAPPVNLPVVAKLIDPKGKELHKKVLHANTAGMVAVDWSFADFATTGKYRTVLAAGDKTIGETSFSVEEFVPERMKVEAGVQGDHLASDSVPVAISARWLFGGSASGSKVELSCQVVPGAFTPDQNRTYHYGLADFDDAATTRRAVTLGTLDGTLDADGKLTLDCPPAARSGGFMGAATLVAQAAVFEGDSGRTTVGEACAPLHPDRFYLGLKSPAAQVGAGQDLPVSGLVVDWKGARDTGDVDSVQLELVRLDEEYVYTWDATEDGYRYRRLLRRSQVDSVTVPVEDGQFATTLHPEQDAAGFLVVATAGSARTELKVEGKAHRYWWYGGQTSVDQTPRPQKPGELNLDTPDAVRVGDTITVNVVAPYAGRMLFTAETHDVVDYRWMDVKAGPVKWTVPVKDFVPNLYVSALLVKDPHLESSEAYIPDRAYGVRSVRIVPTQYTEPLKLTVAKEARPYSPLKVRIDVGPQEGPTYVTVAAVDQGILSLTRFESPDPLAQIFAKRALGVDTYETVGWTLLVPPGGPGEKTGGDGGLAGGRRVQMVKPVALWSGVVEVPKSGKTEVTLDVPGYRGELRVMAVSATPDRMGHADQAVTVRDPIVLQTTLPRFLVQGDDALLPVFVSNMSGQKRDIVVDLSVEDMQLPGEKATTQLGGDRPSPVVVLGDRQHHLTLQDGASDTVLFKVRADRAPDAARFRVVAEADGLKSLEKIELPVERPEPEVHDTTQVVLTDGANDLSSALDGWVPGTDHTRVWLTTNPYGRALSHVRSLVHYPYGCIEQTTSTTRPLLYVGTMLRDIDPELAAEDDVDDMVKHGIQRILSMQTAQGGFAYWPGGTTPNAWGTAYATHLLLDAKEAGYEVPEQPLSDALDWLGRQVDMTAATSADDFTTAYAHYVLARAGRARTAQAESVLENLSKRRSNSRYHELDEPAYLLMAAIYLGGDRRYEAELRQPNTAPLRTRRLNTWYFWSDLRSRGFELSVYHDLFGSKGEAGDELVGMLANGLATMPDRWYTTQELAWGLTAIGKWVGPPAGVPGAHLTVGGQPVAPQSGGKKGGDLVWSLAGATRGGPLVLNVPRAGSQRLYAVVSVRGAKVGGSPPTQQGLVLHRELVDAAGKPVGDTQKLGDAIYVKVSIRNTTGDRVQNIALVDRIPAGWEIENPRLGRGYRPDWLDDSSLWSVDYMNLRDDRVEVFGALDKGETKYVVYQVRAVTAGHFTLPPTSAEAMYDPAITARTEPSKVRVTDPWGGS